MVNAVASTMSPAASYSNWMNTMKGAQSTLTDEANIFAPGGSYGAGQDAIIQNQSQKAQASALSNLVSTGMSSGTNALGAKARISSDATTAKLNVADERSKMYANVLSQLAGLKQNMAGGQLNFAELNQRGNLATQQMDLRKWLTTTNQANIMARSTPQGQVAGNGLPSTGANTPTGAPNPNAWGTYGNSSPDTLGDQNSGSTGMSPNV